MHKKEVVSGNYPNTTFRLFKPCITLRTWIPRRYFGSQLKPGTLTAPERFCLVLLRSRPDTVHRFPSRETQLSTSLTKGSSTNQSPLRNITPAVADCRYKVPLTPRLHGLSFYSIFEKMSRGTILTSGVENRIIFPGG